MRRHLTNTKPTSQILNPSQKTNTIHAAQTIAAPDMSFKDDTLRETDCEGLYYVIMAVKMC